MKRMVMTTVMITLALSAALAGTALADSFAGYIPGRLILEFEPGFTPSVAKAGDGIAVDDPGLQLLADRYGAWWMEALHPALKHPDKSGADVLMRRWAVDFDPSRDLDEALAEYAVLPGVAKVWKDEMRYLTSTPNDPLLAQQWFLANPTYGGKDVRWLGGWAEAQGDSNIIIAIIDSGVDYTHPDLGGTNADHTDGCIWTNWDEYFGTPGVDDDSNGRIDDIRGWDFVTNGTTAYPGEDYSIPDNDPMDFGGHGTGCAGTAAAVTNNGVGVSGVAGGCKIMAVRAGWLLDTEQGVVGLSYASSAITYAVDNGANLINCSWGSSIYLSSAVAYAQSNGVQLVNAAGNDNDSVAEYLDNSSASISCAATNSTDHKASFSNYGSWVEVSAPGQGIHTTYYDYNTLSSIYTTVDGTSFSSPLTAGAIALIWSARPDLTLSEAVDLMYATCDDIDGLNPAYANQLGAGRINLLTALGDGVQEVPDEYDDMFYAVNQAAEGDTIAFLGSHPLTGPVNFRDKPLSYLGGWDAGYATRDPLGNPTVVTGSASSAAVTVNDDAGPDVLIDGFRFTGGGGQSYSSIPYSGRFGGGAIILGDATLRNIDITGNATGSSLTVGGGGGLLLFQSDAVLETVQVHGNTSLYGAGVYVYGGAPTLINCDITDNTPITDYTQPALGGGLYVTDAALTLDGCTVSGHDGLGSGGGIYATNNVGATTLALSHNVIANNSALTKGAGVFMDGTGLIMVGDTLSDNVIATGGTFMMGGGLRLESGLADLDSLSVSGNAGTFGGGLSFSGTADIFLANSLIENNSATVLAGGVHLDNAGTATIVGNTVAANSAPSGGAGVYLINTTADLSNNLVAFNTGGTSVGNGVQGSNSTVIFACNDVFGNDGLQYNGLFDPTGSDGNVSLDPLFCDLTGGDYTVEAGSPVLPAQSGCGQIGALGEGCEGGTAVDDPIGATPERFSVGPNYPNPFNPKTTLRFALPAAAHTTVRVYDVSGRLVKTLVDETLAAAVHTVEWTGRDAAGREVAAGVYFYRIRSGEHEHVGQMALIK